MCKYQYVRYCCGCDAPVEVYRVDVCYAQNHGRPCTGADYLSNPYWLRYKCYDHRVEDELEEIFRETAWPARGEGWNQ